MEPDNSNPTLEETLVAADHEDQRSTKKKNKKSKGGKKKSKKMKNSHGLVRFEELPEYMKENEYIRGYYRSEWPLFPHAALSLFSWHNETVNVWTHLVGFFVFLGFAVVHLGDLPQVAGFLGSFSWSISSSSEVRNASCSQASFFGVAFPLLKPDHLTNASVTPPLATAAVARWPFFVFLVGSMFCLLTSSICHLFCCHSRRLNLLLARLDYTGIAVMIITSFFPPIYYIFQCDPLYQIAYLAAISLFGLLTVATLFAPELSRGKFRSYRATLFCGMALFGIIPAVHATIVNWTEPQRNITLAYEGAMAASYLTGTMFYVTRVPERWRPGAFDLAGHSHQIFHVFVVLGALAHYGAALVFLEYRDNVGCT